MPACGLRLCMGRDYSPAFIPRSFHLHHSSVTFSIPIRHQRCKEVLARHHVGCRRCSETAAVRQTSSETPMCDNGCPAKETAQLMEDMFNANPK